MEANNAGVESGAGATAGAAAAPPEECMVPKEDIPQNRKLRITARQLERWREV